MEQDMTPEERPPEEPPFDDAPEEFTFEDPPEEEPQEEEERSRSPLLLILLTLLILAVLCIIAWFVFLRPRPDGGAGTEGPTADAGGPYTVDEAQPLSFDGSGSSGGNLSYSWDFGDGNISADAAPSHSYPDGPTEYDVSLTVTDDQGNVATNTTQVTVNNLPPTANAGGPYTCMVSETIPLEGQCDDPSPVDRQTLTCTWADFAGATLSQPSYTCPATPGEISLTLTATDKDGASAQASASLRVTTSDNMTPTVPPDGGTPTITPTTPITVTPTITPTTPITVTPTITPTMPPDENQPPVAEVEVHLRSKNGLIYGFDGSKSTDPDGTIVSYVWDFGDGNTGEGAEIIHEYQSAGPHTVTLTVTDDQGAQGKTSVEVP